LLSLFVLFPPFPANLLAPVFTYYASYRLPLIAPVTAKVVVAYPVVDICEGDITGPMSLITTIIPW
jgi:hypothetical protein